MCTYVQSYEKTQIIFLQFDSLTANHSLIIYILITMVRKFWTFMLSYYYVIVEV